MRKESIIDRRISLYGSGKEIQTADNLIETHAPDINRLREGEARLVLQSLIDTYSIKAKILFDGNGVYSQKKIIRDIKRVKKNGMDSMTDGLYQFLSLCCGSIAHYNKYGWIDNYPTIDHLRDFFRRNEFGQRVLDSIPRWKTDVYKIVEEIETILDV